MRAKDISEIQVNLWKAAETLRTNSSLASNEYFMPVMGLLFLRHAHHRYLHFKPILEENLPTRGGKKRPLTKEDFSSVGAIFLGPEATYDELVCLSDDEDRAGKIIAAMESIEDDYDTLKGVLPKSEYKEIENDVLGDIIRILDPDNLKNVEGDVFGRIYEFFLTRFAGAKAHDDGEFFTPLSLVSFISKVNEVFAGIIFDPACGSGGMFVQSARIAEIEGYVPSKKLTFMGTEKNATTIRLAKMNLAVHGLEGNIKKANSYYMDPHNLVGKADGLMANPPFNPDDIDASKIKKDKNRLHFGLPSVNKEGKVTTAGGNYVWISHFHSYLKPGAGRGGFVMAASSGSAAKTEQNIRKKLIETGDVHAIVSIAGGFFYTRTLPCDLWFFDRGRPDSRKEEVLMLDARSVFTPVTSTINEFTPEQERNLLAINWLYKGETSRYISLLNSYISTASNVLDEAEQSLGLLDAKIDRFANLVNAFLENDIPESEGLTTAINLVTNLQESCNRLLTIKTKCKELISEREQSKQVVDSAGNKELVEDSQKLKPIAERFEFFSELVQEVVRNLIRLQQITEKSLGAKSSKNWDNKEADTIIQEIKASEIAITDSIRAFTYPIFNATWLIERFPDAVYCDVLGLCKVAKLNSIKEMEYSLSPGRYVGVAPLPQEDEEAVKNRLTEIHNEISKLNEQAQKLAPIIAANFKEIMK